MIFDKLFGKKHKEEPTNEFDKIKKVIYSQPPQPGQQLNPQLMQNNLLSQQNQQSLQQLNNLNNNLDLNKDLGLNSPSPQNNQPVQPLPNTLTPNLNNTNNVNESINNTTNPLNNQQMQQSLPVSQSTNDVGNLNLSQQKNELDLSNLSLDEELDKALKEIEQKALPQQNAQTQMLQVKEQPHVEIQQTPSVQQPTQQAPAVVKAQSLDDNATVLNVVKKEDDTIDFSAVKRVRRTQEEETKKEESESEDEVLYIRLDKYEETLKLIESIKQKIEENEQLLEKIVELKREEDIKLERWKSELNKISKHLTKIYVTLKR